MALTVAINATAGAPFETLLAGQPTGIAALLEIEVYDPTDGAQILAPSGAGITEPRSGSYRAERTVAVAGSFLVRWTRTDTNTVLAEQELLVTATPATPAASTVLSLAVLKARLGHERDLSDDKLQFYLDAALLQAQAHPPYGCGRLLIPDPPADTEPAATRTIVMTGRSIRIPDARELTEVLVDGVAADYRPMWRQDAGAGHIVALTFARPSSMMLDVAGLAAQRTVRLTGRFGFREIPVNLADAIYLLAARYHYEEAAQYADQVEVLEGAAVQSYYRQLPPRTKLVFSTYAVAAGAGFELP